MKENLGAILVNVIQVGFVFVPNKLLPDLSRVSPIKGMKRIFSLPGFMRLMFGLFKIGVIMAVAFWVLYDKFEHVVLLVEMPLRTALCGMLD